MKIRLNTAVSFVKDSVELEETMLDGYITTSDMLPDGKGIKPFSDPMPKGRPSVTRYEKDDIIISNIRPYLKKSWFSDRKGVCSKGVLVFRSVDAKVYWPKYVYYLLSRDPFFDYVMKNVNDLTRPTGDKNWIMEYQVSFPPIEEQKRVCDFLNSMDERMKLLRDLKSALIEYKKGLSEKLLNENTWGGAVRTVELGEIGTVYNGLTGKSKKDFEHGEKSYIRYLQIHGDSVIDISKNGRVDIGNEEKQNVVQYGDTLFTASSETLEEVGFSSVFMGVTNEKIYLNSFCFGFRPNDLNVLHPSYARWLFRSDGVRKQIVKFARGVTRYNLPRTDFLKIRVKLPSTEKQEKTADFLTAMDNGIGLLDTLSSQNEGYKKGLSRQLLARRDQVGKRTKRS